MSTTTYKIQFCGAACGVTGSMYLLHLEDALVLLDAGAFQGLGSEDRNIGILPFNPKDVSYIFLSHAHLDHVGRLPLLCQRGFEGEVIAASATRDIALRVLEDSLKIQQEEGRELFGEEDVNKVKGLFVTLDENSRWEDDKDKIKVSFFPAEHILGSVSILFEEPVSLLYTGDLGGGTSSLHTLPRPPEGCGSFLFCPFVSYYAPIILQILIIDITQKEGALESRRLWTCLCCWCIGIY